MRSDGSNASWMYSEGSTLSRRLLRFLVTLKNDADVVFVAVGIVSANLDDFGNETPARPSFEMDHDVHGITYIRLDGVGAVYGVH